MIIEGLTYGENKSEIVTAIPLIEYMGLGVHHLTVISSLIKGTDDKSWLIKSEEEANKILKGGTDTSRVPG